MEKQFIMNRLQENYDLVESMGYEIVGIFLQGSQNYLMSHEGSDIDCKAIIIPKFNDFVLGKKPVSTTYVCENDEHVDLKDIREMFGTFKKQNINFIEVLFTEFKIINPKYEALFKPMLDNNEMIAHYNNYGAVSCIVGMAMEKGKALEHPYPATLHKIEKFGYDGKQLSHMMRLLEFLPRYINGEPYKDCLISNDRERLINVKLNQEYSLEEARVVAKQVLQEIGVIRNEYMANNPLVVNADVETLMNDVLLNIIRHSFVSELKEMN